MIKSRKEGEENENEAGYCEAGVDGGVFEREDAFLGDRRMWNNQVDGGKSGNVDPRLISGEAAQKGALYQPLSFGEKGYVDREIDGVFGREDIFLGDQRMCNSGNVDPLLTSEEAAEVWDEMIEKGDLVGVDDSFRAASPTPKTHNHDNSTEKTNAGSNSNCQIDQSNHDQRTIRRSTRIKLARKGKAQEIDQPNRDRTRAPRRCIRIKLVRKQ